jgi:hypothetical protein
MGDGSAWRGNWKVRLYERVRERGYDSLTAFAEARPAVLSYATPLSPMRSAPRSSWQRTNATWWILSA